MDDKKILYYEVNKDEYVFYYERYIIFKNSKTNPFMYVNIEREGAKKQLPLYYCDIQKNRNNGFKIKFYNTSCTVNLTIKCVQNQIFFNFEKVGFSGEKLYINLFKRQGRVTGLGLNSKKDLNKTTANIYGSKGNKIGSYDTQLAFSIKGSYFLKNSGIDDWEATIGSKVKISTRQSKGGFIIEFGKKFSLEDKLNYTLKIVSPEDIKKFSDNSFYTGFITPIEDLYMLQKRVYETRRKGYKYYVILNPIINKNSKEFNYYDPKGLIDIGNDNYLVDKTNEANKRMFTNKIRGLLDINIDGFYIDERSVNIMKSILIQNAIIYKNLTSLIQTVSEEYPQKTHIYNKFNSSEKCVGIYSCNYSIIKRKENKYKRALLYSDIRSVFYECREREARKLKEKKKTQIIIKDRKKFIFDDIIQKKPKIKHFKNK